jgi:hypothetical protein
MKAKPDFNIYIINDNADDETKTGFLVCIVINNINIEIRFWFHRLHCH